VLVGRFVVLLPPLAAALLAAGSAAAATGSWLPHTKGASWTYSWRDSEYSPAATKEKVTVSASSGDTFTLAWATEGPASSTGAATGPGTVSFQETEAGLVNTTWSSGPPPATFPILCAQAASCGNSLASFYYNVIWGTRRPLLAEPLLQGTSWTSTGGYQNDVAGSSDYLGTQTITVPAFAHPVRAAEIRTEISQVGAIGDPYGSGVRTVWWVYGVGPVKLVFRHSGGAGAPVTTAELMSTSLAAEPPPPDVDYFPLQQGLTGTFRWTNAQHLKTPEVQSFTIDQASNGSARFSVSSVSGPIKEKGAYFFTLRAGGVENLAGAASAATLLRLPLLGPSSLPAAKRRHFFTVFDLMDFGFNPVLPPYGTPGTTWSSSRDSSDFEVYGVTGSSRALGVQRVTVPAGTFSALAVRTTLRQPGFPWGSGVRTSWFAPGKGLVKLVFQHGDGSVSEVVRLK
jgi:hypothetical protein